MWPRVLLCIVVLLSGIVAGSPSMASERSAAQPTVIVRGWAYTNAPLVGATITVETPEGRTVARARDATGPKGTFALVAPVGERFRVVTRGGTIDGERFDGRLQADVVGYGTASHVVNVNEVTTLAAIVHQRQRGSGVEETQQRVATYLALPSPSTLTGDLRSSTWFSHQKFAEEAAAEGDFDHFVQVLARELRQDSNASHPFTPHVLRGSPGGPEAVVTDVAVKLAGVAFPYIIKAIVGGGGVEDEILSTLTRISSQLDQLQVSVNQITQLLIQQNYQDWAIELTKITVVVQQAWT
ncbi:MAG: hypothetical protein ACRDZ2_11245, partial [Ilumatobacteraceae bacterium]